MDQNEAKIKHFDFFLQKGYFCENVSKLSEIWTLLILDPGVLVLQPNNYIHGNLENRYAEDFLIDNDNMGINDHKNRWEHFCALEGFHLSRFMTS